MTRLRNTSCWLTGLTIGLLPLAAGASPAGEGHEGGLKFFTHPIPMMAGDTSGITGLFWTFLNFIILMWILNKLLFIPLRKSTREKHDLIKGQVEAASAAREEAERVMGEYRERLGRLDGEIEELMADAQTRADADRKRIIADAEAEAERIRSAARAGAEREAARLQRELEAEIVDKAVNRAEETLRRSFGDGDQRTMVDGYVTQVRETPLGRFTTMIPGSLARRYARALVGLAKTPAQRDKFGTDMDAFAGLVRQRDSAGTMVVQVLVAERYPLSQRKKLLASLLRRITADPMVGKFLDHVLDRGRMDGAVQMAHAYRRLADDAAGRVRATITSARPLPPDKVAALKQALQQATGKQVLAETAVDPELIGGVVTQVGSYVIDGSVRTTLQRIRSSLHSE